jgi:hypothetical protein
MIEIDDTLVQMKPGELMMLVAQYRTLVGALLEHTTTDHEGTEVAIGDFLQSGDRAADILKQIIDLQGQHQEEIEQ